MKFKGLTSISIEDYDIENDDGVLHDVTKASNGIMSAWIDVHGTIVVDGKRYSYERTIKIRLKRDKGE